MKAALIGRDGALRAPDRSGAGTPRHRRGRRFAPDCVICLDPERVKRRWRSRDQPPGSSQPCLRLWIEPQESRSDDRGASFAAAAECAGTALAAGRRSSAGVSKYRGHPVDQRAGPRRRRPDRQADLRRHGLLAGRVQSQRAVHQRSRCRPCARRCRGIHRDGNLQRRRSRRYSAEQALSGGGRPRAFRSPGGVKRHAMQYNWTVSGERAARELGFTPEQSTLEALAEFLRQKSGRQAGAACQAL